MPFDLEHVRMENLCGPKFELILVGIVSTSKLVDTTLSTTYLPTVAHLLEGH